MWKIVEAVPASVNPGAAEHVGVFAIWIPFSARETEGWGVCRQKGECSDGDEGQKVAGELPG